MNRDQSTEKAEKTNKAKGESSKQEIDPKKMIPNQADVDISKRSRITKAARRFERYGQVQDAQDLVTLVSDIANGVTEKATHIVAPRHAKEKS